MIRVFSIGLVVLLLGAPAFAAHGTHEEIQAPRSEEELQAPRSEEEIQAPRSEEELQAPRSVETV